MAPPIQFGLGLSLARAGGAALDADAAAYIAAVEFEDGQALESGVRKAINNFVVGCKGDGIWDAIKASCILAGARTLDGALVPLVGTAPTNNNFVSGDYDRETGLVGNGSTKYLDSNRNNNADPKDSNHLSAYVSQSPTIDSIRGIIGVGTNDAGATHIGTNIDQTFARSRSSTSQTISIGTHETGFTGIDRSVSTDFTFRYGNTNNIGLINSQTPLHLTITLFARRTTTGVASYSDARIAFYSIGESLDLAKLDTRVSKLMTDLAAAIP
jgi:hypothetical protein